MRSTVCAGRLGWEQCCGGSDMGVGLELGLGLGLGLASELLLRRAEVRLKAAAMLIRGNHEHFAAR